MLLSHPDSVFSFVVLTQSMLATKSGPKNTISSMASASSASSAVHAGHPASTSTRGKPHNPKNIFPSKRHMAACQATYALLPSDVSPSPVTSAPHCSHTWVHRSKNIKTQPISISTIFTCSVQHCMRARLLSHSTLTPERSVR